MKFTILIIVLFLTNRINNFICLIEKYVLRAKYFFINKKSI